MTAADRWGARGWFVLALVLAVSASHIMAQRVRRSRRSAAEAMPAPPAGATRQLGRTNLRHGSYIDDVTLSPDGRTMASCSHSDRSASLWKVRNGEERVRLGGFTWGIVDLEYSPDGSVLAGGTNNAGIILWKANGEVLRPPGSDDRASCRFVHFARKAKVFISDAGIGRVDVWDTNTWTVRQTVQSSAR